MIDAARDLLDLGMPVIPVCSHNHQNMSEGHIARCKCPGKTPLIKGWSTHNATTEADLLSWEKSFKSFNLGLPLGEVSGYCGIDVDGEGGVTLLQQMSGGDLPGTWEFTTGAGHRLLYAIPAGMKTKKFKLAGEGEHEECALLCSGQQTIMPPSKHFSGSMYTWVEGHSPWDVDCANAPDWLLKRIEDTSTSFPTLQSTDVLDNLDDEFLSETIDLSMPPDVALPKQGKAKKQKHQTIVTDEMLTSRIAEGDRDNTMTTIVGHYCANRDLRRLGKDFIGNIVLKHNTEYCDPPLEESAIWDKINYFYDMEIAKDEQFQQLRTEKPVFAASRLAQGVLEYYQTRGLHIRYDQISRSYFYVMDEKGPWTETRNTAIIQKWIREVITNPSYGDPSWDKRSYIEEVRMALEEIFVVPGQAVSAFDLGAHAKDLEDIIVVDNGVVHWQTGELREWDPSHHTTVSFDVMYDATAECPHFEEYLADWLPDPATRLVMQEYLGYCLIPNTNFRKAIFLYGSGKNGKSILLEFLQDLFGTHAAALSYDGLYSRFGPATLRDRLVNIFDDSTVSFTKDTSIAKNLIAGGKIQAEYKGDAIFEFTNIARFIYSSQRTPRTSDTSEAWFDRWFFFHFAQTFRPSNRMKNQINAHLKEERAGIFNWMIDGLKRLMSQDDFTSCAALSKSTRDYKGQNDSVTHFVASLCVETESVLSFTDLYHIYQIWAEGEALKPVSKKVFGLRVEDLGYKKCRGYVNGRSGQTYFTGLGLNIQAEDYAEYALEIQVALNT